MRGWGICLYLTLQTCAPEIPTHDDGEASGGSSVRRPGSEDPHRREPKLSPISTQSYFFVYINIKLLQIKDFGEMEKNKNVLKTSKS